MVVPVPHGVKVVPGAISIFPRQTGVKNSIIGVPPTADHELSSRQKSSSMSVSTLEQRRQRTAGRCGESGAGFNVAKDIFLCNMPAYMEEH